MNPATDENTSHHTRQAARRSKRSVRLFLVLWIIIIALGAAAAYLYSNHLREQMVLEIQTYNDQQLMAVKQEYQTQLDKISSELVSLQEQVQTFNELLTFTKDNAGNTTDNSNQLYSELREVKQQLDTLQKKMDLLK
ncbi:hypothetical protein ACFSVM_04940 [Paenibacillus shunpengii]|uniref:HemX protein n=1 Tax=Paenibacillus shunpengii TaxID=2054424 RepID=A0ABW5SJ55_9BACL|nr:hypothetical protein [Paenibacillus sp. FSL H7-0326]OMC71545.1 hypothetical protein BK126_05560 [Paenibacillus sp. FSL H7-0326]